MVLIEIDGNYIAMEPMRSRDAGEMVRVYNIIIERLRKRGIEPKRQILDNEASQEYLEAIEWELVPPHNHRQNVAERAIQTAKCHITANIIGCAQTYPMQEWHRLLPQMEMTLNMLHPTNIRPNISAYMYMHGVHDYN
jgi:hypothetical protein